MTTKHLVSLNFAVTSENEEAPSLEEVREQLDKIIASSKPNTINTNVVTVEVFDSFEE
tara:strand:- start:219 stop:392 length:174 start_codon:yes stop_codon:yes gene_type:complete